MTTQPYEIGCLSPAEYGRIELMRNLAADRGLQIHTLETDLGTFECAIEDDRHGVIWGLGVATINSIPHVLRGHYTLMHQYDDSTGEWKENTGMPFVRLFYPGLIRLDRDSRNDNPTEKALFKAQIILGEAIQNLHERLETGRG